MPAAIERRAIVMLVGSPRPLRNHLHEPPSRPSEPAALVNVRAVPLHWPASGGAGHGNRGTGLGEGAGRNTPLPRGSCRSTWVRSSGRTRISCSRRIRELPELSEVPGLPDTGACLSESPDPDDPPGGPLGEGLATVTSLVGSLGLPLPALR
jgi:hypothetical protein